MNYKPIAHLNECKIMCTSHKEPLIVLFLVLKEDKYIRENVVLTNFASKFA